MMMMKNASTVVTMPMICFETISYLPAIGQGKETHAMFGPEMVGCAHGQYSGGKASNQERAKAEALQYCFPSLNFMLSDWIVDEIA